MNKITKQISEDPDCLEYVMSHYFDSKEDFEAADDDVWNDIQCDLYMECDFPEDHDEKEFKAIDKMVNLISDYWHDKKSESK